MNVVSMLPSATEMLYALDVEPVGVTHECDYPPEASEKPTVVSSTVDADASSTEINQAVDEALDQGGVYEIDAGMLSTLEPDVVVSQGICEVCAVDDSQLRATVAELGLDVEVVTTDPHSLADVLEDVERLGDTLGREQQAREVRAALETRIEAVDANTPDAAEGPTVAILDWLDPVMVAGHWIPGMVERCGGQYGLAKPGAQSRVRDWEEIRQYDPDVLIGAPCGFGIDQTRSNLTDLTSRPGWEDLSAVQSNCVFLVDGHHYINRPGPRLVDTLEILADVIHEGRPLESDAAVRIESYGRA